MANKVDDKVVAMSFEYDKFQSGVNKTISSIDNLKKSLSFGNVGKGFDAISSAANRVTLGHIGNSVDQIKNKFNAMHVIAASILGHISIEAFEAGANLVKAFTLTPVLSGFHLYEEQLTSIQTILANTQAAGTKLSDVNKALAELNDYSNKTIYNFSEMSKNIGTFTAAGVDLNTSVNAIKGIANLAALSGSNSEQASTAMYQLSQAIAAGQVHLQDWNSVVNAGLGGSVFQRALATTATAMGTLKDSSLKLVGPMKNVSINGESFRQSLQTKPGEKSWLTSDVLTKTLSTFTGDLTDAQLAAVGFNKEQIKGIQATAKTALNAATQVKTLSQLLDVSKETASTGFSKSFQIVFGSIDEAKKTFTALSNTINNFINTSANARNKVLADWKALGGRTQLIKGIQIAFKNLGLIIRPIKDAFRDIFPATTGKELYAFTLRFKAFAESLKPSAKTVDELHRTFKGLFAILDIGKQILIGVFNFLKNLFDLAGGGQGSFLALTAKIGDFIYSIDQALKKGNNLNKFFTKLAALAAIPIKYIKELGHALGNLFSGFSPGGISVGIDGISKSMTPFQKALQRATDAWHNFIDGFGGSDAIFKKVAHAFTKFGQAIGPVISNAVSQINYEAILQVIRTGLLVGIFTMIKKFLGKGAFEDQLVRIFGKSFSRIGGGIIKNVNLSLQSFTGTMQAMQTNLKAKTLKEIAIAIALLAASVVALSFVDPKRLTPAMTAMTIMLGELVGTLKLLDDFISAGGAVKIPIVASALILLATAIDILTVAVFALSRLSWDQLKKGLGGVIVLLGSVSGASILLSKNAPGMIRAGLGIQAIAIGLNIMALAVRQLSTIDAKKLAQGLIGIDIGLLSMVKAFQAMPRYKGMISQSIAIIGLATALNIMAKAVKQFGSMNLQVMGKGLLGVAAALKVISLAMSAAPKNLIATATALLIVSLALGKIVKAVGSMGAMPLSKIARGLIGLGGALLILSEGLDSMTASIGGAVALTAAATGIALLVPPLIQLGKQSGHNIAKSLLALGGAFAVIGAAGIGLDAASVGLLAFGAALLLIGGGLALAGAGVALVGVGLSAIAVAGPTAVAILIKALTDFVAAIPKIAQNLVLGLLSMVKAFSDVAPKFVDAVVKILNSIFEAIPKLMPKIIKAIESIVDGIVKLLSDKQDKIIAAGFALLIALLKGIDQNMSQITRQTTDIVVKFINGLAQQANRLVTAGANLLVSLVNGIANNIIKVVNAGVHAAGRFITAWVTGMLKLIDVGAQGFIDFLNGMAKVIKKREPEIIKAYFNIGVAIVQGMIDGIGSMAKELVSKALGVFGGLPHAVKKLLGIASPSKVFADVGQNIVQGLIVGIKKNQPDAHDAITNMSKSLFESANNFKYDKIYRVELVITPVLDLSHVKKDNASLERILGNGSFGVHSTGSATVIQREHAAQVAKQTTNEQAATTATQTINYEQNNYSPKALSPIEVYRQTKNQLAKLKVANGIAFGPT